MFVQVIHVLDPAPIPRPAHRDEVEHRQVLDELTQSDSAGVWADRHTELRGQQQVRDVLVDSADSTSVDLQHVNGLALQELLNQHAVLGVLTRGDEHRVYGCADPRVAGHVKGVETVRSVVESW